MSLGAGNHGFYAGGRRFELRSWRGAGSVRRFDQVCVEQPRRQREVLEHAVRDVEGRIGLRRALSGVQTFATGLDEAELLVDVLAEELSRGRLMLWTTVEERPFTLVAEPVAETLDLLGDVKAAELRQREQEQPLNVLVRIEYDPLRPESLDDRLRLFSTEDEGGTYTQEVDLASEAQTQRDGRQLLVLFKDVVPDQHYSCFLDLGGAEGGYLVFHRHRVGNSHRVPCLPRDAA